MDSQSTQNLTLLAIGVFVSLIVTVAAVDQYLFDEHPPSEVGGLLWRVENAYTRIRDLEAVVVVTEAAHTPIRMRIRMLNQPLPSLSIRYLAPAELSGQIFTVENDLLSHALPNEGIIVVKRWVGLPLAAVGLASLDVTEIQADWEAGRLRLQVLQSVPAFLAETFTTSVTLAGSLTEAFCPQPFEQPVCPPEISFCPNDEDEERPDLSLAYSLGTAATNAIRGEYILEVRDATTDELLRMVWIDRETYYIHKVVFFSGGQREKSIELQQVMIDQGLTADDVLTLPRGLDTLRG